MGDVVEIENDVMRDFGHASVAVGVTAVQVAPAATLLHRGLIVKADINNTGVIYVGKSTVTAASATLATAAATDGFQLGPGHEWSLPLRDASGVYAVASAAGQRITITYG